LPTPLSGNKALPAKKARFFGQPANLETKTAEFLRLRDAYIAQGRPVYSLDENRLWSPHA
jgi:hypothetical protein